MQVGRCIGAGAAYFPGPASENLDESVVLRLHRKKNIFTCLYRIFDKQ